MGNTAGFVVSVLNAYFGNNKYFFEKTEKSHVKPLLKTYASYGFIFLLATGLLFIMVECFEVSEKIAPLLIITIAIPVNFSLNKFWAFK